MNKATLPLLFILVLFGNGLRSVISSTLFVSEATFASFLKISVTQTSAILELLLGAVLLSLLVSPWLIARFSIKVLTTVMCLLAGISSLGLAAMFWVAPPVAVRELIVIILFPLIGFSLASMAPIAQIITKWGSKRNVNFLTGVWAVAMPTAFLITPQLVHVIAPRYGIEIFFAGFAVAPFVLISVIWLVKEPEKAELSTDGGPSFISLLPAVFTLLLFEVATLQVTMLGVTSRITQASGIVFLIVLAWFVLNRRKQAATIKTDGVTNSIFASLFLVNMATTGFYDTAYLFRHLCSSTLIADRATFGALAQVTAAMGATMLMVRYPVQQVLMVLGAVITAVGLASYLLYFNYPFYEIYVGSRAITGFGSGLLTTAAIFSVTNSAAKSANLSLFVAFVIIIGTEVGLEGLGIYAELAELAGIDIDVSYSVIFLIQFNLVLVALPFAFAKHVKRPARPRAEFPAT